VQQERRPRLIFINRYFFPDHSATSQLVSDLSFHLATRGWEVHAITSRQRYDDASALLAAEETANGVSIHRVKTSAYGRSGLIGRGLDYLSFYWSMARALRGIAQSDDIVVAKTDPPLLSIVASFLRARRPFRLINWLQDLYPEVAAELDIPLLRGPLGRALARLRNRSLRKAEANVVIGTSMQARLQQAGIAAARIRIIPNWTDDQAITPQPHSNNPLRREWQIEDKFVLGYSGNLGRAHDFWTILGAAGRLRDRNDLVFLMVGGGKQFDLLAHEARWHGLMHLFRFLPYQPNESLSLSLGAADAHWISLRPELEGLLFTSKLYGIAAAGRPILAVTSTEGELAHIVRENACGYVIAQGDAEAMAQAIGELASDPARCAEMGRRARAMLDAHFTRAQALARWEKLIEEVLQKR